MRERLALWAERLSIVGLAVLLATLPFWRHRVLVHRPGDPVFFEFRDVTLYTNDLAWFGAISAWLLSRLLHQAPGKMRLGPWFITGPLVGFIVLGFLGTPLAIDPLYAGYQALRLLLLLALYLLLMNLPLSRGAVAWSMAAGLVIQAVFAVPQFVLGQSLGLKRLGEVTVKAAWPGASVVMVGEQRWLRAYGLAQHPNLLAGCLVAMLLVIIGYYLAQPRGRRLLLLVTLALGFGALLLTFSRAGWAGMFLGSGALVVLLAWAWRSGQGSPHWAGFGLLAVVLVLIAVGFVALNWPLLQPRLGLTTQGTEIRSVEARLMQVPAAMTLIGKRPVLGVGLGNYPTALYRLARDTVAAYPVYQPVYSVPLLVAAELGLLGGLLWLLLLPAPWLGLWARRRGVRMTAWWAGVNGALLALTAVSFADFYVWSSHQGQLTLWLVLGLWAREWSSLASGKGVSAYG
ncbi:MAG: O-antigen ligase family protein [Anaerolineae bacterium]